MLTGSATHHGYHRMTAPDMVGYEHETLRGTTITPKEINNCIVNEFIKLYWQWLTVQLLATRSPVKKYKAATKKDTIKMKKI